jgi:hypothetical protein
MIIAQRLTQLLTTWLQSTHAPAIRRNRHGRESRGGTDRHVVVRRQGIQMTATRSTHVNGGMAVSRSRSPPTVRVPNERGVMATFLNLLNATGRAHVKVSDMQSDGKETGGKATNGSTAAQPIARQPIATQPMATQAMAVDGRTTCNAFTQSACEGPSSPSMGALPSA